MLKKVAKRNIIIEAAIETFGKEGFNNSKISEIARRANVAQGAVYQYFKNKEDLFFSIPIEKANEFSKELDLHLRGIIGPFNKVRKFVWFYLYFFSTNPEYSRIVFLEMRVSRSFIKTKTYDSFKKSTAKILNIIREGQEQGLIRADVNIYIIRHLILGILEHMVTRWLLKKQKYDLMEYQEDVCRLIIDGMKR